jgi:transcriptional regulator with XRE-family HTH domain
MLKGEKVKDTFRKRLKDLRESNKLSQADLSKILGIAASNISKYESGDLEPNLQTIENIANVLETSTDYLFGKTNSPVVNYNKQTVIYEGQEIELLTAAKSSGLSPKEIKEVISSDWFRAMVKNLKGN